MANINRRNRQFDRFSTPHPYVRTEFLGLFSRAKTGHFSGVPPAQRLHS
jgi:hypothetical protein